MAVSREELGAWLMRRNPLVFDLSGLSGPELVGLWCVRRSYRLSLIRPGDHLLLWLSGRHPTYPRGIWASGAVTDLAGERVGVRLRPLVRPLTDQRLRTEGIDGLEVQRQPMGSNPSWVSREQWSEIAALLRALDADSCGLVNPRGRDPRRTGAVRSARSRSR